MPAAPASCLPAPPLAASAAHQRRLREVWRSAGWPCQDLIEAELLAAGLLERVRQPSGHETLRVTDAGVAALAATLARNRARRGAHEALVERVAREMTRAGRIAWREWEIARLERGDSPLKPKSVALRSQTAATFARRRNIRATTVVGRGEAGVDVIMDAAEGALPEEEANS